MNTDLLDPLRRTVPDLAGLRRRLLTAGGAEADVTFAILDSPHGSLLVASTPAGLARVAFELEGYDGVLDRLAASIGPRILRDEQRAAEVHRQLDEYFEGRRTQFELPLDLRLSSGFRRSVLEHLRAVPYGATVTYASLAASAGNARAVRATGTACATNPLPIVVPCHRVVRSDGAIGNYLGGASTKRALLTLEAAVPSAP